ncbi:MAG: hypothetical protein ABI347_10570 [Nitrososphaera sp.]|jgi:hypothetical protein
MNIAETEDDSIIIARTCGGNSGRKKVAYSITNPSHALCLDRKDIILAEIEACERLFKYADESEKKVIEREIADLRMTLDLLT